MGNEEAPSRDQRTRGNSENASSIADYTESLSVALELIEAGIPVFVAKPDADVRDEQTMAAVRARAKQLADSAPPLTNDQAKMVVSLFARYPGPGDDTAAAGGGVS